MLLEAELTASVKAHRESRDVLCGTSLSRCRVAFAIGHQSINERAENDTDEVHDPPKDIKQRPMQVKG